MRRMVQNSEQDRSEALRKAALLQHQQADLEEKDLRSHLNKIADLEREHLKLTATQTLAEVSKHTVIYRYLQRSVLGKHTVICRYSRRSVLGKPTVIYRYSQRSVLIKHSYIQILTEVSTHSVIYRYSQRSVQKSSENIPESVTTSMRTTLSCSFTYPLMIVSSLLTVLNHV